MTTDDRERMAREFAQVELARLEAQEDVNADTARAIARDLQNAWDGVQSCAC